MSENFTISIIGLSIFLLLCYNLILFVILNDSEIIDNDVLSYVCKQEFGDNYSFTPNVIDGQRISCKYNTTIKIIGYPRK